MKKRKKREMSEAAVEAIVELILTIILSAVGFVVCFGISRIFSVKIDVLDLDSYILIGIIFLIFIIVMFYAVRKLIKKIKEKGKQDRRPKL